eukprot:gb/GECG01013423.1/.p1 GENE.gb/GECG01013423.1/~~gb/GECG01013423.1/.p1  ORF type:complete len:626 (+),score=69.82 gb/GECG01013423.1/:1-1878(+)
MGQRQSLYTVASPSLPSEEQGEGYGARHHRPSRARSKGHSYGEEEEDEDEVQTMYAGSGGPCSVPGLVNEGNTCYLNGVIQALASVPPAVHFLYRCANMNGAACELLDSRRWNKDSSDLQSLDSEEESDSDDDSGNEESLMQQQLQASYNLSRQLARLVCDLNNGSKAGAFRVMKDYLIDTGILSLVDGGQQDAHELLFGTIWAAITDVEVSQATKAHSSIFRGLSWMSNGHAYESIPSNMEIHSLFPTWNMKKRTIIRGSVSRKHRGQRHRGSSESSEPRYHEQIESSKISSYEHTTNMSTTLSQSTVNSRTRPTVSNAPRDPFTGIISRRTTCLQCGFGDPWKSEEFTCLSVVLPSFSPWQMPVPRGGTQSSMSVTLEQLMRNYFGYEGVADWKCEKCAQHGCERRTRLSRLPEVLCIHLQRNSCGIRNSTPVKFKQHLKMNTLRGAPLMDLKSVKQQRTASVNGCTTEMGAGSDEESVDYVLMSAVRHVGGAAGGHYIAHRRQPFYCSGSQEISAEEVEAKANSWQTCNDRTVSSFAVDGFVDEGIQQSVYLLFYMRINRSTVQQVHESSGLSIGEMSVFCPRLNEQLGLPGYPRWPLHNEECDAANCRKYYFPLDTRCSSN